MAERVAPLANVRTQPMAGSVAGNAAQYGAGAITLKAAHPDPFSGGTVKAKVFLQQVDNKIEDAAGASDGRMIRYATSLLRGTAAEWSATNTDESGRTTFRTYEEFRTAFLERFTDPNPSGTAVERLLNLRQGRMGIQEFATKVVTLAHRAMLGDQATKALVFRGLHPKDQDRVMLANSVKTENELNVETIDQYLRRVTTLIRRDEVRRGGWRPESSRTEAVRPATWGHGGDPMELDNMETKRKETRKCFKCGKVGHIRRFCRQKDTLNSLETSENGTVLAEEGSQDEEL